MALSFFKKNKKDIRRQGGDTNVSSQEVLGGETEETTNSEKVNTKLSIHPDWSIKDEELYVYRFLNNELPPLLVNQLSLSGIELVQNEKGARVTAFVRSTVKRNIEFNEVSIILLNDEDKPLAKKTFDLSAIGKMEPNTSRPWHFIFEKEDLLTDKELPAENWRLAFELKNKKHQLDLDEKWEKNLTEGAKANLTKVVDNLPPLKKGEVNFLGFQAKVDKNEALRVTMLIRNGGEKSIQLHELPLIVEDATGETIASGNFTLNDFTVKANTTRPWTFIFPKELIKKEDMDLSTWKAYPPQVNKQKKK